MANSLVGIMGCQAGRKIFSSAQFINKLAKVRRNFAQVINRCIYSKLLLQKSPFSRNTWKWCCFIQNCGGFFPSKFFPEADDIISVIVPWHILQLFNFEQISFTGFDLKSYSISLITFTHSAVTPLTVSCDIYTVCLCRYIYVYIYT